jgi:hypothetical protein
VVITLSNLTESAINLPSAAAEKFLIYIKKGYHYAEAGNTKH